MIELPITFRTQEQKDFFTITKRNSCFSGGFGNGKSYAGCEKLIWLLLNFKNYRVAVARYEESKLRETTMKTFFKIMPPSAYDPAKGGNRADSLNRLRLVNGSEVIWMNLKDTDEGFVRGLEVNSVLVDQAEEISENMYLMLSARVGRWDMAEVPAELLKSNPNWPISENTKKPAVPNYMMILCNPDSELHWIYKRYHPDSEDFKKKYSKNHQMVQGETTAATIDKELLDEMMENDEAWVDRFVKGKWGIPGGQIHSLKDESVIEPNVDFIKTIITRGHLTRVLDHGDSAPTCCLWFSSYKNWYFCYREYYKADALISDHREAIYSLSENEKYWQNLADPAIFKKQQQKYGGRWCYADEYLDQALNTYDSRGFIKNPGIFWQPADNDEFSTRNRISELLRPSHSVTHPITGQKPAPRLYFIKRSDAYPYGSYHAISQIKAQKREKVGTVNGKDIFSDERDQNVVDHAYDCIRYFCASHAASPTPARPKAPDGSFFSVRKQLLMNRNYGQLIHA